jgi:proteasome lid subunit RPN8/RPN11
MSEVGYHYAIDYFTQEGKRLGSVSVEPDWGPARECAQFLAIRRGIVPPILRDDCRSIEPVWDAEVGAPVVDTARILVPSETGDAAVCEDVPALSYFRPLARRGSETLIERGLLQQGELYRYQVCAYPGVSSAPPGGGADSGESVGFRVEEVGESLPLADQPMEPLLACAESRDRDADSTDLPVLIRQRVMDEVLAQSRDAGEVETGGVLVGNLCRCSPSGEMFLEVTAQIPARHTESRATRLTFTADSWTAVRAALELRKRNELMSGWWHYHPDFCRQCPEETRRKCVVSRPFFSTEDIHMHRTVFARAFQVALLVSDHGGETLESSLYGWRHGMVVSRGFHVFDSAAATAISSADIADIESAALG